MSEVHELTDTEVESVCGGVSDLGKVVTKAVDDVISAAIGSIPGNAIPPGLLGPLTKIMPL
jgi:hypothetical protein